MIKPESWFGQHLMQKYGLTDVDLRDSKVMLALAERLRSAMTPESHQLAKAMQQIDDDETLMAFALGALNDPEALGERAKTRLRARLRQVAHD